jgi:hypothetical protein
MNILTLLSGMGQTDVIRNGMFGAQLVEARGRELPFVQPATNLDCAFGFAAFELALGFHEVM